MHAIQTISVQLYLQGRGIKGTREHLEAIIKPLQEQYGPRHQTFSDTATIEIPYSQLPQFILFNVFLGAVVNKLKGAGHPPDYIASALTMSVTGIATEAMHPAVGVSLIQRSCRDLQAGIYNAFVP
jgi:hypothetical protein